MSSGCKQIPVYNYGVVQQCNLSENVMHPTPSCEQVQKLCLINVSHDNCQGQ